MREHLGYSTEKAAFGLKAAKPRGDFEGYLDAEEDPCEKNQYFMIFQPGSINFPSEVSPIVRRVRSDPDGEMEHAPGEMTPVWFVTGGLVQAQDSSLTYWSGDPLNRAESFKLPKFPQSDSVNNYFLSKGWVSGSNDKDVYGDSRQKFLHPTLKSGVFGSPLEVDLYVKKDRLRMIRFGALYFDDYQELEKYPIAEIVQEFGFKDQAASIRAVMRRADQAINGSPQEQLTDNFAVRLHCSSPSLPVKYCYIDLWRRPDLLSVKCSTLFAEGF